MIITTYIIAKLGTENAFFKNTLNIHVDQPAQRRMKILYLVPWVGYLFSGERVMIKFPYKMKYFRWKSTRS